MILIPWRTGTENKLTGSLVVAWEVAGQSGDTTTITVVGDGGGFNEDRI